MSRSNLRVAIIVLTIITAVIHLGIGAGSLGTGDTTFGALFVLNGVGYLVLLAALFTKYIPVLSGQNTLSHYLMIGFAAVTIIAFFAINRLDISWVSGLTKLDELLLIIVTYMHLRAS
jgi:hypothetical protein